MRRYYYELVDDFSVVRFQPYIDAENDDTALTILLAQFGNKLDTIYVEDGNGFRCIV